MKKLILIMVLVLVMMPFASFAKTAISDGDLGAVTAQSGVSIDFSNLTVSGVNVTIQSWGDTDGFGTYTTQGWVGAAMSMTGNVVGISGTMNIDVGTSGTQTRLKIDLPTVVVGAGGGLTQDQTIKLSSSKTLNAAGFGTLGQSYMAGLTATITGSIQIYAH
jgi:hypothetical protein